LAALVALPGCGGSDDGIDAVEGDATAKSAKVFVAVSDEPAGGDIASITSVKAVNEAKTKCADGTSTASCDVVGLDLSALQLTDAKQAKLEKAFRAGHALLKGKIAFSKP